MGTLGASSSNARASRRGRLDLSFPRILYLNFSKNLSDLDLGYMISFSDREEMPPFRVDG